MKLNVYFVQVSYMDISPEIIAAAVNDNQQMSEYCKTLSEKITALLPENDVRDGILSRLEDITSEFVSNSLQSVHYLTRFDVHTNSIINNFEDYI